MKITIILFVLFFSIHLSITQTNNDDFFIKSQSKSHIVKSKTKILCDLNERTKEVDVEYKYIKYEYNNEGYLLNYIKYETYHSNDKIISKTVMNYEDDKLISEETFNRNGTQIELAKYYYDKNYNNTKIYCVSNNDFMNINNWRYFQILVRTSEDSVFLWIQNEMDMNPILESYTILVNIDDNNPEYQYVQLGGEGNSNSVRFAWALFSEKTQKGLLNWKGYNKINKYLHEFQKALMKYNSKGQLTEKTLYRFDGTIDNHYIYEYDKRGNLSAIKNIYNDNSTKLSDLFEYDETNLITKHTIIYSDSLQSESKYKYDNSNRLIEVTGSYYKKELSYNSYGYLSEIREYFTFTNDDLYSVVKFEYEYF